MDFDIEYIAKLSRIQLNEAERESFSKQFSAILDYINKLNELDTSDVNPTAHILDKVNVFREDEVQVDTEVSKEVLKHSPSSDENHFIVPPVIE